MEKILKEILGKLNSIESEVNDIKTEVNDIKTEVNDIKTEMKGMKTEINDMKTEINDVKIGQQRIEEKVTQTYEQVFRNTEAIEAVNLKISRVSTSIDYLKHKEQQHEEELFTIKKNFIEVIK